MKRILLLLIIVLAVSQPAAAAQSDDVDCVEEVYIKGTDERQFVTIWSHGACRAALEPLRWGAYLVPGVWADGEGPDARLSWEFALTSWDQEPGGAA